MKTYLIKINLIELETDNYHIFVNGRWNGKMITLCLDTGASQSCFDINFFREHSAQKINAIDEGLKVSVGSSNLEVHFSTINHLSIGRFRFPEWQLALMDLSHINDAYKQIEIPQIAGILGGDFFVKYNVIIDYFHKTLIINKL